VVETEGKKRKAPPIEDLLSPHNPPFTAMRWKIEKPDPLVTPTIQGKPT
jgi:hypothetical protein